MIALLLSAALGAELDRWPYLQQTTPTSVRVVWRTDVASEGTLRWGAAPDALTETLSSSSARQHEVLIEGLEPGSRVYYAVDVDGVEVVSHTSPELAHHVGDDVHVDVIGPVVFFKT